MKAVYTLPVLSGVELPLPADAGPVEIDESVCSWRAGEDGNLSEVVLEFRGLPLTYTDDQRILPGSLLLQERAFRIARHVANQIYLQTALEVINPKQVVLGSPDVFPEGTAEIEVFARTPRRVWRSLEGGWAVRGAFDPSKYAQRAAHSVAHGYCADALRTTGVFQRYELLFKIIEYFFQQDGPRLDAAVSKHLVQFNPAYTPQFIESLRQVRNRVVHPRARAGSLQAESLPDVVVVRTIEPQLRSLVIALLNNPPC